MHEKASMSNDESRWHGANSASFTIVVLPGAERKERGFYLHFYHNSKRSSRIIKKEHTIFGACFISPLGSCVLLYEQNYDSCQAMRLSNMPSRVLWITVGSMKPQKIWRKTSIRLCLMKTFLCLSDFLNFLCCIQRPWWKLSYILNLCRIISSM